MGTRLYVGNIPYGTTDLDLRTLFGQNGRTVSEVKIVTDRETGQSRGFAFVEMAKPDEAAAVITELNGANMGGRQIVVNEARERTAGGPMGGGAPRSFGGPPRPSGPGGPPGGGYPPRPPAPGGAPGGYPPRPGGFSGAPRPGGFSGAPRPGGFGGGYQGRGPAAPPPVEKEAGRRRSHDRDREKERKRDGDDDY